MSDPVATGDLLYRGVITNSHARFSYAQTTALCNAGVLIHGCDPVAAHIFCRALSASVLSSTMIDDDERMTIHWNYDGALKSVMVDVGAQADVRGMMNTTSLCDIDKAGEICGSGGSVEVVKSNAVRQINSGVSDAGLLDVVEDLAYFFSTSDQIETGMIVLVQLVADVQQPVQLCQGFMVQAMADCDLEMFEVLRQRLGEPAFRKLMARPLTADNAFEDLVRCVCGEPAHIVSLSSATPEYRCRCSREKSRSALSTIPKNELRRAAETGETLAVNCHFCNERYSFGSDDISALL